ncbi:MAG: Nin1 binding protein [Marteilia pararefringens]
MGLNVVDLEDNKFITELKYYTSLCRYCGLINRHQGEKFCVHCGLKGMSKVTASLTKNGDTKLHLSKHFSLNTKKGFDEPTKRFKGGKHPNMGALSKGHRVAQERAPCKRNKNASRSSNHNVEFTGNIFQPHILNSKAFKNGIK